MSATSIRVEFSRPMGLFTLRGHVLLPHETTTLHVFEPRYLRLVGDCLDRSGQFAMATAREPIPPRRGRAAVAEPTAPRGAVCVCQVLRHERLDDAGRLLIFVHGVCRARIAALHEPEDARPYRTADLEPLEPATHAPSLPGVRERLRRRLRGPLLAQLEGRESLLEWIDHEEIPTRAIIELVAFHAIGDPEAKYDLLAEGDPARRADLVLRELSRLEHLRRGAEAQSFREWPKGLSWN